MSKWLWVYHILLQKKKKKRGGGESYETYSRRGGEGASQTIFSWEPILTKLISVEQSLLVGLHSSFRVNENSSKDDDIWLSHIVNID